MDRANLESFVVIAKIPWLASKENMVTLNIDVEELGPVFLSTAYDKNDIAKVLVRMLCQSKSCVDSEN